MFHIDDQASCFIKNRTGAISIELCFEPALGGCQCSPKNVTGSYVPKVKLTRDDGINTSLLKTEVDGINIYYPSNLQTKEGFNYIQIRLRRILFWGWLELEGAKGIPVYNT